jgi:NAD(P)-dependent dehydrogenase (short-subunit alcohol dehydrogenase family)
MKKKVALITGGTRGIGLGIARYLSPLYNIAVNGVREEKDVADVIGELRNNGNEVIYCRGDISLESARSRIIEEVREHYGHLNFLVNNAGVAPKERKDLLETTPESFEYLIRTNLMGPFFLSQAAANWMIHQKENDPGFDACIVNVTSVSSTMASINRGEYCISKAGLSMMSNLFAVRLGDYNIPVFEVRPGIISTDMTSRVKEKYDKMIREGITVQKRWGLPEDIGKAVAAIVSGSFSYSSGSVFMIDGGLSISRL